MGFMSKIAELFSVIGKRLKKEKKFATVFYSAIAAVVVLLVVVFAVSCGKDEKPTDGEEGAQKEIVTDQETEAAEGESEPTVDYTVPDVPLEENAHADVNDIVNRYFNAMTNGDSTTYASLKDGAEQEELIKIEKESAYIDEFDNIKVYTKPGPLAGSQVAFVYYEIKFTGIDTLAPGLTTLYFCPREDGSLYICDANMTEQDTEYIKAFMAQTDVADLFAMVETKYAEALDADTALKDFMSTLSAKLDAEVSAAMAQTQPEEGQEQEPAESQTQEPEQPQNVEELVKATDTVNVRASDSENADRIGRVAQGETITRYEKKENGWSRVSYDGNEGYIKSEYLEVVETADNSTQEETTQEAPEEETEEDAPTTDLTAKGKVTIKETVNVRKSASTSADKLGVAYKGEHYDLIMEQADGWCKIKFNGETGYVKTEFVE